MDYKELKGLADKYTPLVLNDYSQKVKDTTSFSKFEIVEVERDNKLCHRVSFKPGMIGKTHYAFIDPESGQIIERSY